MRVISLIDFPDHLAEHLMPLSAHLGFEITRQHDADEIPVNATAVFVCGDRTGWLEKICQIRETHGRIFVVIATHTADHRKWLDALEAGANDYCCAPMDTRQFEWLRRDIRSASSDRLRAATAPC